MEPGDKSGKDIFDIVGNYFIPFEKKVELITKLLESGSSPDYIDTSSDIKHSTFTESLRCNSKDPQRCSIIPLLLIKHGVKFKNTVYSMYYVLERLASGRIVLGKTIEGNPHLRIVLEKLMEKNYVPSDEEIEFIKHQFSPSGLGSPRLDEEIQALINSYIEKIKKNTRIKNIRERKSLDPERLTGINHPSTAFIIMGHGNEATKLIKIVPKGCILVVQVHSGELSVLKDNFFTNIFNDPEKEKFLDPVTHYKHIVDRINLELYDSTSLAIYREGDKYPDFFYTLFSSFNKPDNKIIIDDSGVAKYPFMKEPTLENKRTLITLDSPIDESFLDFFNKSEYPNSTDIKQIIDILPEPKTLQNFLKFKQFQDKIETTQSILFEKLGQGVYYNFVCRATRESIRKKKPQREELSLERIKELVINSSGSLNKSKLRKLIEQKSEQAWENVIESTHINNNQRRLVNASGHINKSKIEILQQIGEAHLHRAPLIAKLNKNNPNRNPTPVNKDYGKVSDTLLSEKKVQPQKYTVKNATHELVLQDQMKKQRDAHDKLVKEEADNEFRKKGLDQKIINYNYDRLFNNSFSKQKDTVTQGGRRTRRKQRKQRKQVYKKTRSFRKNKI